MLEVIFEFSDVFFPIAAGQNALEIFSLQKKKRKPFPSQLLLIQ